MVCGGMRAKTGYLVFSLVVFIFPGPLRAELRCILQVAFDEEDLAVVQLCSGDTDARLPLPLISPYSVTGSVNARLPVPPSSINVQKDGASVQIDGSDIVVHRVGDQYQVQISYRMRHGGRDWFVVASNHSGQEIAYQVVTRKMSAYWPQVRPLEEYTLDQEDDTGGAWVYMTLNSPLLPAHTLVVFAGKAPDQGFVGGWLLLGVLLAFGLVAGIGRWSG